MTPEYYPLKIRGATLRGGRVLLTEIMSPRIARQGSACLISTRGQARTTRIGTFELDEGFQPYYPPWFYLLPGICPQMLESIGQVNESQRKCWTYDEGQGISTLSKKTPGEK